MFDSKACILAAAALFGSCASRPLSPVDAPGLAGEWMGKLDAPNGSLVTVLRISSEGGGPYSAAFLSPMQSTQAFPVASIRRAGKDIIFSVPALSASYRAVHDGADGLAGQFSQGGMNLPLDMERQAETYSFTRPQDPVSPFPYSIEEISFEGGEPGVILSGTLNLPGSPWGAVVLVSGSGPQDRDETLMGHRPFAVIADALARAGWASLRYDDRGTARSTGDFSAATTDDFALDAGAALAALRKRPELQGAGAALPAGVLGHSEGALIAALLAGGAAEPRSSATSSVPSFCILLGGQAYVGEEIIHQQSAAIMRASGASELQIQSARTVNGKLYALARDMEGEELRRASVKLLRASGLQKEEAEAQAQALATPWFRRFLFLDPEPLLRNISVPVLALYGSLDLQVIAPENPDRMRGLLSAGDGRSRVVVLEGLNHLFQPATTGLPAEYGIIETTVDPAALTAMLEWMEAAF